MATLFENFQLDGYRDRELLPIFLKRQALLRHAMKRWEVVKGDHFKWPLSIAAQDLQTYGKYATFDVGERSDEVWARLPLGQFVMVSAYSGLEMAYQGKEGSLDDGTIRRIEKIVLEKLKTAAPFRLNREVVQGDGAALNSSQGATLIGLDKSVIASPTTGTYAEQSRVSLTDWRNGEVSPTSGPSGDPQADAGWLLYKSRLVAGRARKAGYAGHEANILLGTETILADIINRYETSFATRTATINGVRSVFGFETSEDMVEDDLPGNHLYVLSGDAFCMASTAASAQKAFHLDTRDKLPWHVRPDDTALVWWSEPMQFVNKWPKAHVIVPSWHV